MYRRACLTVLLLLVTSAAQAHTGIGATGGFAPGFLHPIGGLDHVLAMIAVGLFAARLGGSALWLVPLSFVVMLAAGGVAGMAGFELPFVEIAIALSVVVFGAAVAAGLHLPTVAAMALVGLFAVFHGHAHGTEMPQYASGLSYAAGFVVATALLHAAGIAIGQLVGRFGEGRAVPIARFAGNVVVMAGAAILVGIL